MMLRSFLVVGDLMLNTRDFSSLPAQPALYQHRVTDFQKAGALCRTIPAKAFHLLASLVSAEGHTKCIRSTPIQLSAQLASALDLHPGCPRIFLYELCAKNKSNNHANATSINKALAMAMLIVAAIYRCSAP
jgi:hypothetical protein